MKKPYKFTDLVNDLESNKPLDDAFLGYKSIWDEASNYPADSFNTLENWSSLKQQVNAKPKSNMLQYKQWWKVAASLVVLVLVGVLFAQIGSFSNNNSALVVSFNNSDTLMKVILSDKSIVLLSPKSTVKIKDGFNNTHRLVTLEGNATFSVQKSDIPFVVLSNRIQTTVLGTVFEVVQQSDITTLVKVFEGKVQVAIDNSTAAMLTKGKMAVVNVQNNQSEIIDFDLGLMDDANFFTFENIKLEEIVTQLEKQFKTSISYPQHLNNELITTSLPANDLNACLHILSTTVGQQIVLNP
jgi:ferric-dicitrate binding protein FerR (iron transport regulator)